MQIILYKNEPISVIPEDIEIDFFAIARLVLKRNWKEISHSEWMKDHTLDWNNIREFLDAHKIKIYSRNILQQWFVRTNYLTEENFKEELKELVYNLKVENDKDQRTETYAKAIDLIDKNL